MQELRRVFAYCRRYQLFAWATFSCAILSTLSLLLVPYLTGRVFELLANRSVEGWPGALAHSMGLTGVTGQLNLLVAGALLSFFGRDVLNSARIFFNNLFEQRVIFDIRSDLYQHIQRLPLTWFEDKASGDIMTRISEDVTNMERVLIDGIEQGSVAVLQIGGLLLFLFWVNPELAFYTMIPIPLMILGAWWFTTVAHKRFRRSRQAASDMNSLLMDNLSGIAQIKAYVRETDEWQHFRLKAEDLRSHTLHAMKAWAVYNPAMTFFASFGTIVVLFLGGRAVLDPGSGFTHPNLVEYMVAVGFLYDPINRLHGLNQLFQSGRAAAERVFGILDTPVEVEAELHRKLPAVPGPRTVEFKNISFRYDSEIPVLNQINLTAEAGQSIALVGPTGAGKSTLVGLIPRFYQGFSGQILIDGVDNQEIELTELRTNIGLVSQEAFLFNDTLRRNLLFGHPKATESECWEVLEAANAREFVESLPNKLDTNVGERGIKLSGGEKQRISIARALLKNPPILILDEATASVDTATEKLIQKALDHLLRDRTSFVIAHRLSTITRADQILVLNQGEIIERGSHDELVLADGLYARLCRAQNTATIEHTWEAIHP